MSDVAAVAAEVAASCRRLLAIPSVVGFEGPFLDHLWATATGAGLRAERRDGAVVVAPERDGPVLSAHADRHGLVHVGDGALRYAAHVVVERRGDEPPTGLRTARRVCERVADEPVVAYDPQTGAELARLRIPHDCEPSTAPVVHAPEAASLPAGTPLGYAVGCALDDGHVQGQLDNTISVAVTLHLAAGGWPGPVVLTAGEEVGESWRHLLGALDALDAVDRAGGGAGGEQRPGRTLLVLDTSPFDGSDEVDAGTVVLRRRDAGADFDAATVAALVAACDAAGVPRLFKDEVAERDALARGAMPRLGRTELGRLVAKSGGRCTGATVQLPTFGYHTNEETTSTRAIANVLQVLAVVAARWP